MAFRALGRGVPPTSYAGTFDDTTAIAIQSIRDPDAVASSESLR